MQVRAEILPKLAFLFEPADYKVVYGGRGGGKSWGIARALLVLGAQKPMRIMCAREFQNSIEDSAHKLLDDQIKALGLQDFYTVQKNHIYGANGTEIGFRGLRRNIDNVKGAESIDIVWCEESHNVSANSWNKLIPTIRKKGSEIWISFNPELKDDETYKRFVKNPPPGAKVVKIGYQDNIWLSEKLRNHAEYMRVTDPDTFEHVYGGEVKRTLEGAVYAKEIRQATAEGRITRVPLDSSKPVSVFFDLGRADMTAAWFAQKVGLEFRVIDYYQANGYSWSHYLKMLQDRNYLYETIWLPHDADNELLASERTILQQTRALYKAQIVPKQSIASGIEAARALFPMIWIDEEKCDQGLDALSRYHYEHKPEHDKISVQPVHDIYSHGADAFRYMGIALRTPPPKKERKPLRNAGAATSWLGA